MNDLNAPGVVYLLDAWSSLYVYPTEETRKDHALVHNVMEISMAFAFYLGTGQTH